MTFLKLEDFRHEILTFNTVFFTSFVPWKNKILFSNQNKSAIHARPLVDHPTEGMRWTSWFLGIDIFSLGVNQINCLNETILYHKKGDKSSLAFPTLSKGDYKKCICSGTLDLIQKCD